jgi:Fungal protein kinase
MFDIIEREGADAKELNAHRHCMRKILVTTSKALDDEGQGLPNTMPDLRVIDVDPTISHAASVAVQRVFHRQAASFFEVKINEKEEPEPRTRIENFIKTITAQAADYAGLHFASRPFQIFVIGFVIYGRYFRAALFTHSNVYFSEKFDILTPSGLEMLVRVIRSVTWQLTDREMGLDPAVSLVKGYTFYGPSYPRFVVRMTAEFTPHDHPPSREISTSGPPLWSSLSWLGRSTSIWKCMDGKILKVAWRNEKRMGETDIYGRVGAVPGVAQLVDGGDVLMMMNMGSAAIKLDSNYIIKPLSKGSTEKTTDFNLVLHRVVLDRLGKPLWSYSSIEELVHGLLAALAGLFDRVIFIHRKTLFF